MKSRNHKQNNVDYHFQQGNDFYSQSNYQQAIYSYNQAIQSDPLDEEIYYARSKAYVNLRQYEQAIEDLDKVIRINPKSEDGNYAKANALLELGKEVEAAEYYRKVLEINPENEQIRASFAYSSGNYEEAIKYFDIALEKNPKDTKAYYYKGSSLYFLNQYTAARDSFAKALEIKTDIINNARAYTQIDPYIAKIYNAQGLIWYDLKRHDLAEYNYNEAIKLNNQKHNYGHKDISDALPYYNMGNIFYDLGDHKKAINHYNTALGYNPNLVEAYNGLGLANHALGEYHTAILQFNNAIVKNPQYAEVYNNWGNVLLELQEYEGAKHLYDKAIKLTPQFAVAYYNKGKVLSTLWQKDEAIDCFDKAIKFDPEHAVLYLCHKSMELKSLGKEPESIHCLNRAYELAQKDGIGKKLSEPDIRYINNLLLNYADNLVSNEQSEEIVKKWINEVILPIKSAIGEIIDILKSSKNKEKTLTINKEEQKAIDEYLALVNTGTNSRIITVESILAQRSEEEKRAFEEYKNSDFVLNDNMCNVQHVKVIGALSASDICVIESVMQISGE